MDLNNLKLRARDLDQDDALSHFRRRFRVTDEQLVYLDGNSLGRLTLDGADFADRAIESEWGARLVRGWNEGWYERAFEVGSKIARLLGAQPGEVVVSDSTSVNLFKLVCAALQAKPNGLIISDSANFPSDLYVLQGACKWLGREEDLRVVQGEDRLWESIDSVDELALLTLSHVCFKSGYMYDAKRLTKWAHQQGGLCLWDLSHSAGSVPVDLNLWDADLAVGCTYKYLNGGPGAPAFLYVAQNLQHLLESPIWGWFGQRDPFSFETKYEPADGLSKFLVGTPPIISLTPIAAGVDLLLEAGMDNVRAKSIALTNLTIEAWDIALRPLEVALETPREVHLRGSHVSFSVGNAYQVDQALIREFDVIPDFRAPNTIRFGMCPLYTTFGEVIEGVERLALAIKSDPVSRYPDRQHTVT